LGSVWRPAWHDTLPGARSVSIGWLLLAGLFFVFLDHTNNFTAIYGSLGGIIVTLLSLFLNPADFILGAEFNVASYQRRKKA
jgi:membrane protein